jgi:N-carbamoyl-L-amino-acid hydrolase
MSQHINSERLWDSLMRMAEIGATPAGGCNRQALSDEDRAGRALFQQWCSDAGLSVRIDAMGNLFARRDGSDNSLPPVITGSHLDTQPTGGKFDGVYGVLAGLEVMRSLNEQRITTRHPLEVVVWTNEEGARFSPAMIGSGVWCGEFSLEYGHRRSDKAGLTIRDELQRTGYLGEEPCTPFPVKAAFEAHIEQGPILEAEQLQVGVVTGVQGMHWYDIVLHGQPCHAGPTPMPLRRDPFMALGRITNALYALANETGPDARVTFGDIKALPGARNTVPEKLVLAVDIRHPDQATLEQMDARMHSLVQDICKEQRIDVDIIEEWKSPAVRFDADCIDSVQSAVSELGYSHRQMVSGAGHDSVYVSRVAPTSMIFVPCAGGLSHNEAESATADDLAAGCDVLFNAMLRMAERSKHA